MAIFRPIEPMEVAIITEEDEILRTFIRGVGETMGVQKRVAAGDGM